MTRREFLALLNDYFECVLGPVLEHQGEVLRFIGDAASPSFRWASARRELAPRPWPPPGPPWPEWRS